MYKNDSFNISDLIYILNCRGLNPSIIDDKLVIFHGEQIIFSKKISDLFINDLVDLGIDVTDSRFVSYLVSIARDIVSGKRKSLTL